VHTSMMFHQRDHVVKPCAADGADLSCPRPTSTHNWMGSCRLCGCGMELLAVCNQRGYIFATPTARRTLLSAMHRRTDLCLPSHRSGASSTRSRGALLAARVVGGEAVPQARARMASFANHRVAEHELLFTGGHAAARFASALFISRRSALNRGQCVSRPRCVCVFSTAQAYCRCTEWAHNHSHVGCVC